MKQITDAQTQHAANPSISLCLEQIFRDLGMDPQLLTRGNLAINTPISGELLGHVQKDTAETTKSKIDHAQEAFLHWRQFPAPRRGELVRIFGNVLRLHKQSLGALISIECGKIHQEGLGEVQEMIDICDFAVGLSRQLYGLTMPSERPGHKMSEHWHPAGVVGVISAFNFPAAVWAWNSALALVCGDAVVWKPSEKTPLTALVCMHLFELATIEFGSAPDGLASIVIGQAEIGEQMVDDTRLVVVSATGSTRMGRSVAPRVARRFGRCILELGGNNAMIVTPTANLDQAARAIVFSAVGTAGQRCTTLRRLLVHNLVKEDLLFRIRKAYQQLRIGNPLSENTMVGPLIDEQAMQAMQSTLQNAKEAGCEIFGGDRVVVEGLDGGYYVQPAIVLASPEQEWVQQETFAPILYVLPFDDFESALAIHNDVPQGLSSCIFTSDLIEAETFLSFRGSDCGIANINIGPSGAEIGGAFGGEKETGGGRESGSDAWKSYMRRMTATVNYSSELPLAQGIRFGEP